VQVPEFPEELLLPLLPAPLVVFDVAPEEEFFEHAGTKQSAAETARRTISRRIFLLFILSLLSLPAYRRN